MLTMELSLSMRGMRRILFLRPGWRHSLMSSRRSQRCQILWYRMFDIQKISSASSAMFYRSITWKMPMLSMVDKISGAYLATHQLLVQMLEHNLRITTPCNFQVRRKLRSLSQHLLFHVVAVKTSQHSQLWTQILVRTMENSQFYNYSVPRTLPVLHKLPLTLKRIQQSRSHYHYCDRVALM